MIAETYTQLLRDWPHWAFEGTVEAVTFLVATLPARWLIRHHDRRHHDA
jgi:hypothetical protein